MTYRDLFAKLRIMTEKELDRPIYAKGMPSAPAFKVTDLITEPGAFYLSGSGYQAKGPTSSIDDEEDLIIKPQGQYTYPGDAKEEMGPGTIRPMRVKPKPPTFSAKELDHIIALSQLPLVYDLSTLVEYLDSNDDWIHNEHLLLKLEQLKKQQS